MLVIEALKCTKLPLLVYAWTQIAFYLDVESIEFWVSEEPCREREKEIDRIYVHTGMSLSSFCFPCFLSSIQYFPPPSTYLCYSPFVHIFFFSPCHCLSLCHSLTHSLHLPTSPSSIHLSLPLSLPACLPPSFSHSIHSFSLSSAPFSLPFLFICLLLLSSLPPILSPFLYSPVPPFPHWPVALSSANHSLLSNINSHIH